MTPEQYILHAGLTRCEFDDECDKCDSPSGGTWAKICQMPEDVAETEYYICGVCIEAKANNAHNAELRRAADEF
ncbi:MAG: hypothetical protein ACXWAT_10465 [Methylobacter sp.]